MDSTDKDRDAAAWKLMEAVETTERLLADQKPMSVVSGSPLALSQDTISENEADLFARLGISNGYERSLDVQIPSVDAETKAEIGAEVSSGRILSLRSSTALAANFFGPWRSDPGALGTAMGAPWVNDFRFEAKYPTELSDKPVRSNGKLIDRSPTLDVVLEGGDLPTIAIEAKFTEPYFKRPANSFSTAYFRSDTEYFRHRTDRIWTGLPTLRRLAVGLESKAMVYEFLHAAQLIKHSLGLQRRYGPNGYWLNYVWFDGSDDVSRAHRREIEHFIAIASEDIHIGAISYQELSELLPSETTEYVRGRYFDPVPRAHDPMRNQVLSVLARQRKVIGDDQLVVGQVPDRFDRLSPVTVIAEYRSLVRQAPDRSDVGKSYFVESHNRAVAAPIQSPSETHLQRAMVGKVLRFESGRSVHLIDYEVPLKAVTADTGLGEADLFGVEDDGRHVIVELKIARDGGNDDSPVRALLEGVTYSAVLFANRAVLGEELRANPQRFGLDSYPDDVPTDTRLIVAAPSAYWERLDVEPDWLDAADRAIRPIADGTGLTIEFVDLGPVAVVRYDDSTDGKVIPLLSIDGVCEPTEIRSTVIASWVPSESGEQTWSVARS